MTKFSAVLFVTLLGAFAHAQELPPGVAVPPGTPGYTVGKSQDAGEKRKQAKTQGLVRAPGGDAPKSAEGGAIGNDKAAVAGEQRKSTRDARRPDKRRTTQGGTPRGGS